MDLAAKLDEFGRLPWIAAMVLGFVFFWPVGLTILLFLLWSGRMSCWRHGGAGRWHQERDQLRERAGQWWSGQSRRSSGNRAFDEYKADTLRRLEEEQKEFFEFLDRLRHAKDKAEFDQFMNDRRRPAGPEAQPQA